MPPAHPHFDGELLERVAIVDAARPRPGETWERDLSVAVVLGYPTKRRGVTPSWFPVWGQPLAVPARAPETARSNDMSTRFSIALLLFGIVSSVLLGVGATTILAIPGLSVYANVLLPIMAITSFIVAPVISWVIAPKLRAHWLREQSSRVRLAKTSRSSN